MNENDTIEVIDITSPPSSPRNSSPLRPIFCLKKNADMKRFEEMDDCFVLDFDPYNDTINLHDPQNTTHDHDGRGDNDKEDICIIADKGQLHHATSGVVLMDVKNLIAMLQKTSATGQTKGI
ncbi:hypothetical protein LWI29_028371 [Acer saccharum]|uniref:Uncharacterized protein n=1 Tax=Acer saccharum TaxID=4024 RepID=A0AA39SML2_ACESA|nr:hypothetical protein LWI29_028371 [Acer saccharum]